MSLFLAIFVPANLSNRARKVEGEMLRTLYNQIGRYRGAALATPLLTTAEVVVDVLIPYVTAQLIDRGLTGGDLQAVWRYGAWMLLLALLSLMLGVAAGWSSAYASTGFAANLRSAMYRRIQQFSFANIDRFSTSGLVTRMTTDDRPSRVSGVLYVELLNNDGTLLWNR